MNRGLNRVYLIGTVGRDLDPVTVTALGKRVLRVNLATPRAYRSDENEWAETVDWHRLEVHDNNADYLASVCVKGHHLAIEGHLEPRRWVDANNVVHYANDVIVDRILWCSKSAQGTKLATAEPVIDTGNGEE